ncbi:MAG TPA: SIMPL domain-containing protein [Pyrinomonadaceae bacterium]
MRYAVRLAPALIAAAALACAAACSEKKEPLRTRLLVTGESDSKVPPDTAVVVLSVVTQSARALDAQQQNARKSDAVIQAVRQAAGANPEVQTSDYSLEPQRDWGGGLPRIKGYEARNTVTVTTSALDSVGAILDTATQAGANSVDSVRFTLREGREARGRALGEAGRQAMAKAEAMAQAMGGRIVRVVEEREGNFPAPPPQPGMYDYLASASAGNMNASSYEAAKMSPRTPVEAGQLHVRSQVYLVVEVEAQPRR